MNNLAQVTLVKTEAARVTLALRQVGPQGIGGSVGSILYFGAEDPEAGLGNANDAYFQTTTRGMWTKATGTWVESVRLTGVVNWPEGIDGLPETFPPNAHALDAHTSVTLAELNAKISDADLASTAVATTSAAGLMSAADKIVLDGLPEDVASEGYVDAAVAAWQTGPAFSRASDATFTVTDNAANQAIFAKGRPLRYRETAGTWRYGMVDGYSSGTVTLVGAPLTTDDDEMEYGDPNRVAQVEFFIGGKFADSADTGLLASDAKTFFSWGLTASFLVRIRHRVATDDSGAEQPRVTVSIGGSAVGTDNANAGLAVAEAWTSTTTGINVSNYDIAMGDAMEVVTDANGSNGDAQDLTVSCTFVLE